MESAPVIKLEECYDCHGLFIPLFEGNKICDSCNVKCAEKYAHANFTEILKLANDNGITEENLSAAFGISKSSVKRWYIGKCYPVHVVIPSAIQIIKQLIFMKNKSVL